MKKILIFAALMVAVSFTSCQGRQTTANNTSDSDTVVVSDTDSVFEADSTVSDSI